MDLLTIMLIAVGLSMDAFAVSVCKGLAVPVYKPGYSFICGAWFGLFQGLMPAAGYMLGLRFREYITAFDHWIAFALLGIIGFNMIKEALSEKSEGGVPSFAPGTMLPLSVATSIDALALGITFAFLSVNILFAVIFIGVCTFVISAAGVMVGAFFGSKYKCGAEIAGGLILMLLGIKILAEHIAGG